MLQAGRDPPHSAGGPFSKLGFKRAMDHILDAQILASNHRSEISHTVPASLQDLSQGC